MSTRSGLANTVGFVVAPADFQQDQVPGLDGHTVDVEVSPRIPNRRRTPARREVRSASSTAFGTNPGLSTSARHCSGLDISSTAVKPIWTKLGLATRTYRHHRHEIIRGHHVAFTAEAVMGEIAASACVSKVPMARPLSDQLVVVLGELNRPGFLDAPDITGGLKDGSNRSVTPVSHQCPKTRSDALRSGNADEACKAP